MPPAPPSSPPPGAVVFGGPAWPLGSSVGFLRAPFAAVRDATLAWRRALGRSPRATSLDDVSILTMLGKLAPLETPWNRELLVGMRTGWTAHFTNDHQGGDSDSWVGHLSGTLGCTGLIAGHAPASQHPFPATQLELLGPAGRPPLMYVRTISCGIFDSGRWSFEASGDPQPFEEIERYGLRRKRDRFTREMLIRYLAALDLRPDEQASYGPALLLEVPSWRGARRSSIEDHRRELSRSRR